MAPGYSRRSLRDMGDPYQHAQEVSIVRTCWDNQGGRRIALKHLNQSVVFYRCEGSVFHGKVHQRYRCTLVRMVPKRNPSKLRVHSRSPSDALLEWITLRAHAEQPKLCAKLLIMVRNLIERA